MVRSSCKDAKMDWFQLENSFIDMHYVQAITELDYSLDNLLVLHAMLTEGLMPSLGQGEKRHALLTGFISMNGGGRNARIKLRHPLWNAARDRVCTWVQTLKRRETPVTEALQPVYAFAVEQDTAFRASATDLVNCAIQ